VFESAEVGHAIPAEEYEERLEAVRVSLVNAQYDMRQSGRFSVMITVAGDDLLGVDDVVRRLNEWMDPRFLSTHVMREPTDEETERPLMWRYWRRLPRKGAIGLFSGGMTREIVWGAALGKLDDAERDRRTDHVRRLERALTDDGTLVVKFWLHLPPDELRRRIKATRKDSEQSWRVSKAVLSTRKHLPEVLTEAERYLRATDTAAAPWQLVEATDWRYRDLAVAETIAEALEARLAGERAPTSPADPPVITIAADGERTVLDSVDLSASLSKRVYRRRLEDAQRRLNGLSRAAERKGITTVAAFEGWDAAGKGGCIRRLTAAVDAGGFRIAAVAAPTPEELAHHWLWRFWLQLPSAGRVMVFDRSWYGRVLVERVEGLATESEWRRSYGEINDFEEQLQERGIVVSKFWLHIDPDEQLRRFESRQDTPYKQHKITDEDWRNRERWDQYVAAIHEMVERTSSLSAPWNLVAANNKRHARVTVVETVADRLEAALG
jgi:polyphosphate:AMP phosphotransferase